jgi:1-deoxy-D-xylulose-5-phosphate reductoisomerase
MMKNVVILGSTGSIGRSALSVLKDFPGRFNVFGLSTNVNLRLLRSQIQKHKPKVVVVFDPDSHKRLKMDPAIKRTKVLLGMDGLKSLVTFPEVDLVINALVGAVGLIPTLETLKAKKKLALANKEALVMAGDLVKRQAKKSGIEILPIDSEHVALKQCLMSGKMDEVKNLILTASGGPFYNSKRNPKKIKIEDALSHPTWNMGKKITIDSATLMNKGLEIIEAHHLFEMPPDRIKVLIHPQSIVHSLVEFVDGSMIGQMSVPDMKLPIQYALFYPDRAVSLNLSLDLASVKNLTFIQPDQKRFPSLRLSYRALKLGGSAPCVLNAANEIAVDAFLKQRICFADIIYMVEEVLKSHKVVKKPELPDILKTDIWAREKASDLIKRKQ